MALILDLTSSTAVYGTRLLAEAGHRVIRVEPSCGDAVRRQGPFLRGRADLEHGAYHSFMNAGKESFTLNAGSASAEALFLELIRAADGAVMMRPLPCEPARLLEVNPRLAIVEVEDVANELCAYAHSGLLSMTGHPGKRPVLLGGHAAFAAVGVYVAVAASACLLAAQGSEVGKHVEVSAANCLEALTEQAALTYHTTGQVQGRRGYRGAAATAISGGFPCADGYWMLSVPTSPNNWARFTEWVGDPLLSADLDLADEDHRQRNRDLVLERLGEWSRQRPKHELVAQAQERHIPSSPISTEEDLIADPQLLARRYLQPIDHPDFGAIPYPTGAIAQTLGGPPRLAPQLGQHTQAILGELGYSEADRQALVVCGAV